MVAAEQTHARVLPEARSPLGISVCTQAGCDLAASQELEEEAAAPGPAPLRAPSPPSVSPAPPWAPG